MHKTVLWLVLLPALAASAWAFTPGPDGQVRLFVVEKSKNPQNILVVYSKVSDLCRLEPITDKNREHYFDFYWLMNKTTYKRTHPLIKKLARKRFVAQDGPDNATGFSVMLTDLKELIHDLPSDLIHVEFYRSKDGLCRARTQLALGPSGNNRTMLIDSIYSEAKTVIGIPVGIHYIELRGTDTQNHQKITIRFNSNEAIDFDYQSNFNDEDHR